MQHALLRIRVGASVGERVPQTNKDLDFHVLATNPATGGSITGSVVLTTNQASELLSNLYYINVHTATNPAGEIRGQLVAVDTLPTLVCPPATNAECTGPDGTPVSLTAQVSDADGDALTVIWTVNGVAIQTNSIAAGEPSCAARADIRRLT